jgi:hypothetical protein
MANSDAFTNLQGFNVGLCQLSGAGRGLETTLDASQRYAHLLALDAGKARELINAARMAPDAGAHRHYIDGMESALLRAVRHHLTVPQYTPA